MVHSLMITARRPPAIADAVLWTSFQPLRVCHVGHQVLKVGGWVGGRVVVRAVTIIVVARSVVAAGVADSIAEIACPAARGALARIAVACARPCMRLCALCAHECEFMHAVMFCRCWVGGRGVHLAELLGQSPLS